MNIKAYREKTSSLHALLSAKKTTHAQAFTKLNSSDKQITMYLGLLLLISSFALAFAYLQLLRQGESSNMFLVIFSTAIGIIGYYFARFCDPFFMYDIRLFTLSRTSLLAGIYFTVFGSIALAIFKETTGMIIMGISFCLVSAVLKYLFKK